MYNIAFNMPHTKVTRIGGTLFARIPADEARRLGLREGALIDLQVRPLRHAARDVLAHKGAMRGRLAPHAREDLWGGP